MNYKIHARVVRYCHCNANIIITGMHQIMATIYQAYNNFTTLHTSAA